jgi:hypothetical protein
MYPYHIEVEGKLPQNHTGREYESSCSSNFIIRPTRKLMVSFALRPLYSFRQFHSLFISNQNWFGFGGEERTSGRIDWYVTLVAHLRSEKRETSKGMWLNQSLRVYYDTQKRNNSPFVKIKELLYFLTCFSFTSSKKYNLPQIESTGFWRWYMTLMIIWFLDFVKRPIS